MIETFLRAIALVGEGQCVGIGLPQAYSEAARDRLAASEVEAGGGTIDGLDGKAVLSEEQCMPADAATEIEHMLRAACFSTGTSAATAGCGTSQSSRPSGVAHRSSHASTAVAAILRLPVLSSAAPAVTISGKRRCGGPNRLLRNQRRST